MLHLPGQVRVTIGTDKVNRLVVVDYSKPTTAIGFRPDDARNIAKAMIARADALDKESAPPAQEEVVS